LRELMVVLKVVEKMMKTVGWELNAGNVQL
jgi:hypothetical protein